MSTNTQTVALDDGRLICLSYGVAVAAFVPGRGYVRTAKQWSVTTSRHAAAFAGKNSPKIDPAEFAELVKPVVTD